MRNGWSWKTGAIGLAVGNSAALLIAGGVAAPIRQDPDSALDSCLAMGDKAILMTPPRVIGDGVMQAVWSPSGRHVLYGQMSVPRATDVAAALLGNPGAMAARLSLLRTMSFSVQSGKSILVDSQTSPGPENREWFYTSDTLLISRTIEAEFPADPTSEVRSINLDTGASTPWVRLGSPGFIIGLSAHPKAPRMAALLSGPEPRVLEFSEQGRTLHSSPLPDGFRPSGLIWAADGQRVLVMGASVASAQAGQMTAQRYYWTPTTGEFTPVEKVRWEDMLHPDDAAMGFRVESETRPVVPGSAKKMRTFWLRSAPNDDPNVLVLATDASQVEVSPKGNAVFVVAEGVATVRDFVTIDKAQLDKMRDAAKKVRAINNAKQMGLAMMMYGADFDDEFPSASNFDLENVFPYIKDRSMMEGFTYTFSGGNASSITNPSETEMGFVSGPGGRAVVYMDGHVKWIGNEDNVLADLRRRRY